MLHLCYLCQWTLLLGDVQAAEFGRWLPGVMVVLYDGSPEERRSLQRSTVEPRNFCVLLTHYDLAVRDRGVLRKVIPPPLWCFGAHLHLSAEVSVLAMANRQQSWLSGLPHARGGCKASKC